MKVFTCGVFDGVHLGHQSLLRFCQNLGEELHVVTFHPHPAQVIAPNSQHQLLFDLEDRVSQLKIKGATSVHQIHFTPQFALKSADEFVDDLIALGAESWVLGPDFTFGRNRQGNFAWLRAHPRQGLRVHQAPKFELDGAVVSTSRIREALKSQQVEAAATLLGRPYRFSGKVVHGRKLGARLGFPTANLQPTVDFRPALGVYETLTWLNGQSHPSITNIGVRPTVSGQGISIETHILDFSRELYDQSLQLDLLRFVRAEKKFAGVEDLKLQIQQDIENVRSSLRERKP